MNTLSQKRNTKGQLTEEHSFANHQRNVNQNYPRIPSHPGWNSSPKKTTNTGKDMGRSDPLYAAGGYMTNPATMDIRRFLK